MVEEQLSQWVNGRRAPPPCEIAPAGSDRLRAGAGAQMNHADHPVLPSGRCGSRPGPGVQAVPAMPGARSVVSVPGTL